MVALLQCSRATFYRPYHSQHTSKKKQSSFDGLSPQHLFFPQISRIFAPAFRDIV